MDVIGNNIANVNTTGYKTSRVIFQDIFSQTAQGGTASTPGLGVGGTNPIQIGLGIKLSTVDVLHTPAPTQRTDNPTDMMLGGDGFFIIEGPDGYFYTRAGNFKIDDMGYLVTSDGFFVLGYSGNVRLEELEDEDGLPTGKFGVVVDDILDRNTGEIFDTTLKRIQLTGYNIAFLDENWEADLSMYDPETWDPETEGPPWASLVGFSVGSNGEVTVMANNRKMTIAMLSIAMFSNPSGLEKVGNSLYVESSSSGTPEFGMANQNGAGPVIGGGLEMSNVDLASEFTDMIVTQRGFQANSRIITVSDSMLEELVNLKR